MEGAERPFLVRLHDLQLQEACKRLPHLLSAALVAAALCLHR